MDKLVLEFSSVFWDNTVDWFSYIHNGSPQWVQALNINKYTSVPILMFFNIGDAASSFSTQSDTTLVDSAMATIRKLYPAAPNPVRYSRSNWSQDQYAKMSYTFVKKGASWDDPGRIGSSVHNKLYFAGEHTYMNYIGTVHGAYLSGLDTANAILSSKFGFAVGAIASGVWIISNLIWPLIQMIFTVDLFIYSFNLHYFL